MVTVYFVLCVSFIAGTQCASVSNKKDAGFSNFENFLKTKDEIPKVSHGSSGNVHKVSQESKINKEINERKHLFLRELYLQFFGKNLDDNSVNSIIAKHAIPLTTTGNPPASTKKPRIKYEDILSRIDAALKAVKELGLFDTSDGETNNMKKSADSVVQKKVPTFEEFKELFYKTFLPNDTQQKIVYNGRKGNSGMEKAKSNTVTSMEDLSNLYEDLKKETLKEKRKLENRIDNKEEEHEKKKKELISLINEVTGQKKFIYNGTRVVLVKKNEDQSVDAKESDDDSGFSSLYKEEPHRSMENVFLDAFKKEFKKLVLEKNPEQKDEQKNKINRKKGLLKKYLLDYVRTLDNRIPMRYDDGKNNKANSIERYESELEDIASNKKMLKKQLNDKELLEALDGFNLSKQDVKQKQTGRP